ncbi:MAG: hypothetical protein A2Y40_00075 [Candidatus Margulisbacteria bacterium GWF2_35_9]|nr:MAG: hypothetical protein A2Y40_00075 [Candidatus Margulisbacteria bacterium GWF2_35_9]
MSDKLLSCKHGIHKLSCAYCKEMEDKIVVQEIEDASNHSWHSSSYLDNAAHNSAFVEQEYDIEIDMDDDSFDMD